MATQANKLNETFYQIKKLNPNATNEMIFRYIKIFMVNHSISFLKEEKLPNYTRNRDIFRLKLRKPRESKTGQKNIENKIKTNKYIRYYKYIQNQIKKETIGEINRTFKDPFAHPMYDSSDTISNKNNLNNKSSSTEMIYNNPSVSSERKISEYKSNTKDEDLFFNNLLEKTITGEQKLEIEERDQKKKIKIQKTDFRFIKIDNILSSIPDFESKISIIKTEKPSTLEDYYNILKD